MAVFYVLLLIPILLQHCTVRGYALPFEKRNQRALTFFFVFLTFLLVLRHESVGVDTGNYIYVYENFCNMSWVQVGQDSHEYGFSYFNKFVSLFSREPQIFLAVVALMISAMIYPTYKRLSTDATLTIVLFCTMSTFVMMFSGIRQMIAIAIGFLAYECTRKKKLMLFILAVIVALAFHTSAFMLVFMYPLYHAKITRKWLLPLIPILTIVLIFNKQIFSILAALLEHYTKYDASMVETGAYTMLILFAMFAVFAFLIPDESRMDRETIGLRNFLLFALVLQMFAPLHSLAMRMNYYYIIFIPLLIPKIISCRNARWGQVAVVARHIMVGFFLVYFFLNAYTSKSNLNVFPYRFFWETVG